MLGQNVTIQKQRIRRCLCSLYDTRTQICLLRIGFVNKIGILSIIKLYPLKLY